MNYPLHQLIAELVIIKGFNDKVPDLKDLSIEEIFNQSPEPIMMLEVKNGMPTRYTAVNQAYADQLGYSREECLQLDPNSIMPQSFLDKVPNLMKTILDLLGAL